MTKLRFLFLFFVFLLLSFNAPTNHNRAPDSKPLTIPDAPPPLPRSSINKIDSLVERVLTMNRWNGAALVAIDGYPVAEYCRGYADLDTKEIINDSTVFQIASVSKSFTALSALILYERGQLDLNAPVVKYIPEFLFPKVTIKHLMQHTSGLQNYMYFVDTYWPEERPLSNEDVLQLLIDHDQKRNCWPGQRHIYSNTGYAMLALVVERVSGKRFYDFVRDEIFDPLGMKNTFAWNPADARNSRMAIGYANRYRGSRHNHSPLDEVLGDKSIYSTTHDLLLYDQALYTSLLVSDSTLRQAFSPTVTPRGRSYNYGYGWRLKEMDGHRVIYHNGLWNGFTASLTRFPDERMTIILLNNTNAHVSPMVDQLYRITSHELEEPNLLASKK
jgi:CubicO group peptidase (beta-lactamase class C family)